MMPDADLVAPSTCSKRMNGLDARAATAIVRINEKVTRTSMAGHCYTVFATLLQHPKRKKHI